LNVMCREDRRVVAADVPPDSSLRAAAIPDDEVLFAVFVPVDNAGTDSARTGADAVGFVKSPGPDGLPAVCETVLATDELFFENDAVLIEPTIEVHEQGTGLMTNNDIVQPVVIPVRDIRRSPAVRSRVARRQPHAGLENGFSTRNGRRYQNQRCDCRKVLEPSMHGEISLERDSVPATSLPHGCRSRHVAMRIIRRAHNGKASPPR
jgi:hypothetical protein